MSDRLREAARDALQVMEQCGYLEQRWEAEQLRAALAEQEAEPVAYLLNGSRYKVSHLEGVGYCVLGLPESMNGKWLAFVDATDNKHMAHAAAPGVAWADTEPELHEECDWPVRVWTYDDVLSLARQVEAALKRRNA